MWLFSTKNEELNNFVCLSEIDFSSWLPSISIDICAIRDIHKTKIQIEKQFKLQKMEENAHNVSHDAAMKAHWNWNQNKLPTLKWIAEYAWQNIHN